MSCSPNLWSQVVRITSMPDRRVSQKTIVATIRAFEDYARPETALDDYRLFLYERDFPQWFVTHAGSEYHWDWTNILFDVRNGNFFMVSTFGLTPMSILGKPLGPSDQQKWSDYLVERLASLAATLPVGEPVRRSLQLDGFDVDVERLLLVPLEGPVSVQGEEDALTRLVRKIGVLDAETVLKHLGEATDNFTSGKDHASLNESRCVIQSLVDGISIETAAQKKHSTKLPGGAANRIKNLKNIGFFTEDERTAFESAWGSLSAGSHPGVPDREQARIGLVLALEFGQLLLLKFANWKANGYQGFT
jgi:hypothetical protein